MIISMKLHSTKEEIEQVCERIRDFGYKIHAIEGEERVVIGAVGTGDTTVCLESVEAMPQVEKAVRISAPYKFVSKEYRTERTRIRVDGCEIGGDEFIVMARPCSVESEKQIMQAAGVALRFPRSGERRAEAAAQGQASHWLEYHHRGDERSRRGSGCRLCRHSADRRTQY